jgi:hypothetical protein
MREDMHPGSNMINKMVIHNATFYSQQWSPFKITYEKDCCTYISTDHII